MNKTATVNTTWELRTYDVWGNSIDGYDVNDSFVVARTYTIRCRIETFNEGTEHRFASATPSDYQIRKAFGISCSIDTNGDDLTIYIERRKDGYPIGEMHCVSHASLSPIRAIDTCESK